MNWEVPSVPEQSFTVLLWLPCCRGVLTGLSDRLPCPWSNAPNSDEFASVSSIAGNGGKLGDRKDLVEMLHT